MANHRFSPVTRVSTENPAAVKRALKEFMPNGSITATDEGFVVRVTLTGTSARELDRTLLSTLRRIERQTRLRAEWTRQHDGTLFRLCAQGDAQNLTSLGARVTL